MDERDSSAQAEIRELLARQRPEGMPREVRERIEAALRREQASAAAAEAGRRRWLLPTVAAAAAAVILGGVLLPQLGTPQPATVAAPACEVTVGPDTDLAPVVHDTGRVYTAAALPDDAQALTADGTGCDAAGDSVDAVQAEPERPRAAQARAVRHADAIRCLFAVIPGQVVIAVDRGRYDGKEVLVAVVSSAPSAALVVDCSPANPRVMYRTELQ